MRAAILLACAVMLLNAPIFAAELPAGRIEYTNDGFSIVLPPGWNEVSSGYKLRGEIEERLGKDIPGPVRVYQVGGRTNLEPPFVVVRVSSGRMPDLILRSLLGTNNTPANLKSFLRSESILPANVRGVSFDTNRFVIQCDAVGESEFGRHRALTRIFFTEESRITVSALSTEADYTQWWGTLGQIVESVQVRDALRYRLRPPPNLSGGSRDWLVLGGAVVGMLLLGFVVYRFNTSSGSTADY